MLKVWRGKSTIFAECTDCGSYGTANHLQPEVKVTLEIAEAIERHAAHMMALRSHYTGASNAIATQIRNGSISRKDGTAKIRDLWTNHVAQVRLGEASLPSPEGKVKEIVTACPWCNSPSEEVEIETLPDDTSEPNFSLAKKVVPETASRAKRK